MAPSVAVLPSTVDLSTANPIKKTVGSTEYDVCEDYEGNYRFAPIEEAQVSRAMIKRLGTPVPHQNVHLTQFHIATST